MKKFTIFLTLLALLEATSAAFAGAPTAGADRLAAAGLYIQEFWICQRPGYWIANGGKNSAVLRLIGRTTQIKQAENAQESFVGPVTIPAGGAVSVDAGCLSGASDVLVRDANDSLIDVLKPPSSPPSASLEPGNAIRLYNALNRAARPTSSIWFEVNSIPPVGATSFEAALKVESPLSGFVVIRNSANSSFPAAQVSNVSCSGLPVRRASDGDWYIDIRKSAHAPLQTVRIQYSLPATNQQSVALIEAMFEGTNQTRISLRRAVLIGQPVRSPSSPQVPRTRVKNRSNRGR